MQLDSVVFGIAYYHLISLADRYFNETGKSGQGGSTHRSRGEIAVEREGSERLSVDGGFTILHLLGIEDNFQALPVVMYHGLGVNGWRC